MTLLLTTGEIETARVAIDPVFLDSPLLRHTGLDRALGCTVSLKIETLNPIRSFKGRGTEAVLASLLPRPAAVVTASSGNFGQGIAWAARRRGVAATVFAPADTNPLKAEAMRRLGADVRLVERGVDESDVARAASAAAGAPPFIEDGAHREIAAGAGTIAQEMTAAGLSSDVVLVQIGDGALITGIASWLRATSPRTRVVGVTARNAPAMAQSVVAGRPLERPAHTMADGMSITRPVPGALEGVTAAVDEILEVEEDALLAAMRLLIEQAGVLAEPSGAAGIAALLEHGSRFRGAAVAAIITGSNLDPRLLPRLTT